MVGIRIFLCCGFANVTSLADVTPPHERIKELSNLIAHLPLANYSLLRALSAHLILVVQNSNTNKMTLQNVGIVFSPTLGIPAGVFSLMLGEFNRVFDMDDTVAIDYANIHYTDVSADELYRLSARNVLGFLLPLIDRDHSLIIIFQLRQTIRPTTGGVGLGLTQKQKQQTSSGPRSNQPHICIGSPMT